LPSFVTNTRLFQKLYHQTYVTGKFACNNLLLNRKQTCWNILKPETTWTNSKRLLPIKTDH